MTSLLFVYVVFGTISHILILHKLLFNYNIKLIATKLRFTFTATSCCFFAVIAVIVIDPFLKIILSRVYNGGVFLLRQSGLTDLARCVCRSFIRPSVSFLVF